MTNSKCYNGVLCFGCSPVFNYNSFKSKKVDQSLAIFNYFLKLDHEKYPVVHGVFVNESSGYGLARMCVGYAGVTQKTGLKKRAKDDPMSVYHTVSTAAICVRAALNSSRVKKVIINISNMNHAAALIVGKTDGRYHYTCYNVNNDQYMSMVDKFINKLQGTTSPNRVRYVRCLTRKGSNPNGMCFPFTWLAMHRWFEGKLKLEDYETHFTHDLVAYCNIYPEVSH